MCGRNVSRKAIAFCTNSGLFFNSGKMPTFTGATRGWNRNTTRVSALPFSSVTVSSAYAFANSARIRRSTPALGSITCGMYCPLASPSTLALAAAAASSAATPDFVR